MKHKLFNRLNTAITTARELLDDKTASIVPEMYGRLKEDGSLVEHGTRIKR